MVCEKSWGEDRLEHKCVPCRDNPAVGSLVESAIGGWSNRYGIDKDYTIEGLDRLLASNNEALSRLIWATVCYWCRKKDIEWLQAQYRNNSYYPTNTSASQLVCTLRDTSWVPQTDGRFVRPAEAVVELLPEGFPYDKGNKWLEAVRFGEDVRKRLEEQNEEERNRLEKQKQKVIMAKMAGFRDLDSLERAKKFAAMPFEEQ